MKAAFELGLNQHGYAFQHRIIREALEVARDEQGRGCKLLEIECPVEVNGLDTRIDFLLEHRSDDTLNILVAECKRVNPAYGSWCFAKGAFHTPEWARHQLITESIARHLGRGGPFLSAGNGRSLDRRYSDRVYTIGFVLKTSERGDAQPVSRDTDAIEDACGQVCK